MYRHNAMNHRRAAGHGVSDQHAGSLRARDDFGSDDRVGPPESEEQVETPAELFAHVREILKVAPGGRVSFAVTAQQLVACMATMTSSTGARVKEALIVIKDGRLFARLVVAEKMGLLESKYEIKATLANDDSNGVRVLAHSLKLPVVAAWKRRRIERWLDDVTGLVIGYVDPRISDHWALVGISVVGDRLVFEFTND